MQAVRDFDEDLVAIVPAGVEVERLTQARDNLRALRGLVGDFGRANAPPDE